ncbi:hypothetical protein [Hymenobacter sp. BT190]|uniref:hypothetical protein n=1 Tax=Hymenobacter sp. BT190 TaxID=2763505 RepID=UPI001651AD83|nr:hypothetical protein [Hymenobacter sp. BT190]MBC6698062.1 hypothetical protein [Hymenobacter sp. BT190]
MTFVALLFLTRFEEKYKPVKIEIPVKPYTLKFLQRYLGSSYKLSFVDPYGIHLFNMLRSPRQNKRFDALMGQYKQKFVVSIDPVRVIDAGLRDGVAGFSSAMVNDFNAWVESVFKQDFHSYVETHHEMGLPVFSAIRKYCDKHQLTEDDISQETLRTSYKRYLKKEVKRRKMADSSFPLNQAA